MSFKDEIIPRKGRILRIEDRDYDRTIDYEVQDGDVLIYPARFKLHPNYHTYIISSFGNSRIAIMASVELVDDACFVRVSATSIAI